MLVKLTLFKTSERLAKGQISNNIKGREVVPGFQIKGRLLRSLDRGATLPQTLDEEINVAFDNVLLCAEALVAEPMAELPSDQGMVVARLAQNVGRDASGAIKGKVLAKLLALYHGTVLVAVNVLPCVGIGVQQGIRRGADNGAVRLGEVQQVTGPFASEDPDCAWEPGRTIQERAGILAQRMKVEIVDDDEETVSDKLYAA